MVGIFELLNLGWEVVIFLGELIGIYGEKMVIEGMVLVGFIWLGKVLVVGYLYIVGLVLFIGGVIFVSGLVGFFLEVVVVMMNGCSVDVDF